MKNPISKKELISFARNNDAVAFDAFCEKNKINNIWLDVSLMNFNDEYYNVELPDYELNVCYYNGVLEEVNELLEEE